MKKASNLLSILLLMALALTLAPNQTFAQGDVVCDSDVTVQADDWLSKIADKFYGNPLAYPAIVDATNNKATVDNSYNAIDNPDVIEPGWKLCVPSVEDAQKSTAVNIAIASQGQGEAKYGGTLYIGQDFGPGSLDPHKTLTWASVNIFESIYDGLVKWNDDETALVPDLATSWTISDDGTVYTFKIRQGVKFHNGREMTAEDVKFSIDRLRSDESVHSANFQDVTSVEILDPETVQITLSKPVATFLMFLTERQAIVPMEAVDQLETNPIGTGPFMLEENVLDQYVRLVKNPDYYEEGLPYLDAVEFKILGDEASKEAALRAGSVDMLWFRDPRQAEAVAADIPTLVSAPGIPSRYIDIRLNHCEAPFDDVNVRRALSLAMDREKLIETVIPSKYGGAVSQVIAPSSRFFWDKPEPLPYYTPDVEQAKALLAEAGYPDGLSDLEYKVVAANQLDVDGAQVLKQQWLDAGIDVNINPMEVSQIISDWRDGNGKMIQVGVTWTPDPDVQLYDRFHSSGKLAQAYCINDPVIDDLMDKARATTDIATRKQLYLDFQERLADQAHTLVLYGYPLRWEVWQNYVKGYFSRPSNSRWSLRFTWLDRPEQ